ncbi:hypothetical protein L1785_13690 [Antribacter sp. KLBMP9083]|uniref:Uncharacterized protein n=1 Tax=Antribacter soli TaxID=2910976 RepID=A0AA41QG49_9MICO|nr:hypothetical protein [Antribacter soli]MCF4122031.1 hypothetical protein [Antribacter soli]
MCDILLFRRRGDHEPVNSDAFLYATPLALDKGKGLANEYFVDHPEHVLGHMRLQPAGSTGHILVVAPDGEPLPHRLATALTDIVTRAREHGLTATSATWNPPAADQAPGRLPQNRAQPDDEHARFPRQTPPARHEARRSVDEPRLGL